MMFSIRAWWIPGDALVAVTWQLRLADGMLPLTVELRRPTQVVPFRLVGTNGKPFGPTFANWIAYRSSCWLAALDVGLLLLPESPPAAAVFSCEGQIRRLAL